MHFSTVEQCCFASLLLLLLAICIHLLFLLFLGHRLLHHLIHVGLVSRHHLLSHHLLLLLLLCRKHLEVLGVASMARLNTIALGLLQTFGSAGRGSTLLMTDLRGAQRAQTLLLIVAQTVKIRRCLALVAKSSSG